MPQLERGGKYVFGWSQVSENGVIVIPGEAVGEYGHGSCTYFRQQELGRACDGDKISPKTI